MLFACRDGVAWLLPILNARSENIRCFNCLIITVEFFERERELTGGGREWGVREWEVREWEVREWEVRERKRRSRNEMN